MTIKHKYSEGHLKMDDISEPGKLGGGISDIHQHETFNEIQTLLKKSKEETEIRKNFYNSKNYVDTCITSGFLIGTTIGTIVGFIVPTIFYHFIN